MRKEGRMHKRFVVDVFVYLSGLDLFVQEEDLSEKGILEDLYELVFGFPLIIEFIDLYPFDNALCVLFEKIQPFFFHGTDYSNSDRLRKPGIEKNKRGRVLTFDICTFIPC